MSQTHHLDLRYHPKPRELNDVNQACSRLWFFDNARLVPNTDYNLRLHTNRLFNIKEQALEQPTYSAFVRLVKAHMGENPEDIEKEQSYFLSVIAATTILQYLNLYIKQKRQVEYTVTDFLNELQHIWFDSYPMDETQTCAFKHLFIGEPRGKSVQGLHSCLQVFLDSLLP